ncbi:restriction endonuclease subunit S [Xanthomonas axonopodis]
MSEWPEKRLAELADIGIGGTPSRVVSAFWAEKPNGYPWLSISDLKAKYVAGTKENITALGVRSSNVKVIPAGTTVMSFKLTVGRTAITALEMYCNEAIAIFQPRDKRLNSRWLYHALPRSAAGVVTDTAVKGATLNKAKMAEMKLRVPSPSEQAKIAEVLDTLDTAIHETEALIAKLKAVKQGLLHDLLTRGIDANGELRPPQSEAPHLYKLSPLGWIPNEWVVDSAGSILAGIDAGWSPSCPEEPPSEGEWGVLKVSAVSGGAYDARQSKRLPPNLKPILSIEVRVGDVLLARANGVADLVAKTVLVRDTPTKLMLSDKILRLVPNEKFVRSDYLVRIMMHAGTRSQINGMMNGSSGQRNISQSQIRSIIVPIPPIIEQAASMERLNELVGRLEGEMKILQKRKSLKHALMDDLLTGRVRVTPLLDAATA